MVNSWSETVIFVFGQRVRPAAPPPVLGWVGGSVAVLDLLARWILCWGSPKAEGIHFSGSDFGSRERNGDPSSCWGDLVDFKTRVYVPKRSNRRGTGQRE